MERIYRSCDTGETPGQTGPIVSLGQLLNAILVAAELPGKGPLSTFAMLLTLCERFQRSDHLMLAPKTLRESKLTRATVYRSLEILEQAGLVTVKRQKGLAPMVTLIQQPNTAADAPSEDR